MTGNVLKEIEENIKDYEEQGIEQIPLSLVKYWISVLEKENEELKSKVKRYMEIELLKAEDFANCHNCRNNRSVHDGVALDGMCAIKELMNLDGYFDTEYHKLPKGTICPCWEWEE